MNLIHANNKIYALKRTDMKILIIDDNQSIAKKLINEQLMREN